MRIDVALSRLRFVKTRALAHSLVEAGHVRRNGRRVIRTSQPVEAGDVLTIPLGKSVRVIELAVLPARRGPASEARSCYRVLDPDGQTALAASQGSAIKGNKPQ